MNKEQKQEFIERSRKHFESDMYTLTKGIYGDLIGDKFEGCSVGCHRYDIEGFYHRYNRESFPFKNRNHHKVVANYYDFPEWLAHLQDTIFEGLPIGENLQWHVDFPEAIPAIDDYGELMHDVHIVILEEALKYASEHKDVVQRVIDLHKERCKGKEIWAAAKAAARSAVSRSTTWSAVSRSTTWASTWASTWTTAWAARSAAESAGSAKSTSYSNMAKGILKVFKDYRGKEETK